MNTLIKTIALSSKSKLFCGVKLHNTIRRVSTQSPYSSFPDKLEESTLQHIMRFFDYDNSNDQEYAIEKRTFEKGEQWYKNGMIHRDGDLPAVQFLDGTCCWYNHGNLHRDGDCPAVTHPCGLKKWYMHGFLHRKNGPAIQCPDGSEYWYNEGYLHREDGPAVIIKLSNNKSLEYWYKNGLRKD